MHTASTTLSPVAVFVRQPGGQTPPPKMSWCRLAQPFAAVRSPNLPFVPQLEATLKQLSGSYHDSRMAEMLGRLLISTSIVNLWKSTEHLSQIYQTRLNLHRKSIEIDWASVVHVSKSIEHLSQNYQHLLNIYRKSIEIHWTSIANRSTSAGHLSQIYQTLLGSYRKSIKPDGTSITHRLKCIEHVSQIYQYRLNIYREAI